MDIGKGIRMLLDKKGMSQKQLAMEAGLSQTTISQIMSSDTIPRRDSLESIAKALQVKPEFILLLGFGREDVQKDRRALYELVWPHIEAMMIELFTEKN
jgi:transcriptional regulator with XRE-family HTH domain